MTNTNLLGNLGVGTSGSSLLFFFLLLVILYNGGGYGFGQEVGAQGLFGGNSLIWLLIILVLFGFLF